MGTTGDLDTGCKLVGPPSAIARVEAVLNMVYQWQQGFADTTRHAACSLEALELTQGVDLWLPFGRVLAQWLDGIRVGYLCGKCHHLIRVSLTYCHLYNATMNHGC